MSNESGMARSLVILLYVRTALASATPEQRAGLRTGLRNAFDMYKVNGDASLIKAVIDKTMGPVDQWMSEEDAQYIVNIGGGLIGR